MTAAVVLLAGIVVAAVGAGIIAMRRTSHWGYGILTGAAAVSAVAELLYGLGWWAAFPAAAVVVTVLGWISATRTVGA